jgi:hypothetical protein
LVNAEDLHHVFEHVFDAKLCRGLDVLFKGKDVLDLGAGIGYYGRCFLRKTEPLYPDMPYVDEHFFKYLIFDYSRRMTFRYIQFDKRSLQMQISSVYLLHVCKHQLSFRVR